MTKEEILKRNKLKWFIEKNFDFYGLKENDFWPKGTRKTDYEKIAARICHFFGYESIYEYKKLCRGIDCDGKDCSQDNEHCKSYNKERTILKWNKLEVDVPEIYTKDEYLN